MTAPISRGARWFLAAAFAYIAFHIALYAADTTPQQLLDALARLG